VSRCREGEGEWEVGGERGREGEEEWKVGGGGGKGTLSQIEPRLMGPVPTYRVNKHKDRRDIRQQM
jgi:hypothetical protein